ncbi:oligosaccharyl transferase alpha subunit [Multifurca ochricompacta]|uniref:Dolichyl-diphosphooligosaccharide--protein glycosyltransferase subunit 1 n=1 Tax=Multifurca ochricompacta TaxID=376703 RepID=A0AAD4MB20_9AGAM|nr:oligosaccharyl transferase alpha subunit [Multifurca ochricompacta]
MVLPSWLRLPAILFATISWSLVSASTHSFENTAIVRTVDLGGSLVHVTTTYAIRALDNGVNRYIVSLGENEARSTSWFEAKLKGQNEPLSVTTRPLDPTSDGTHSYVVELPKPLSVNGTVNLVVETVLTHATYPWPKKAAQKDDQSLKYEGDLLVLSPYKTWTQRIKVRAPAPRIISYTTPDSLDEFTTDQVATKSGATVTYGPFSNIPPSASTAFIGKHQRHVVVHYYFGHPVVEIASLKRVAEISHWGANLNIQNDIVLRNAGPTLKGQFARIEHQSQTFYNRLAPHIIPSLTFHLPPGIHSAYYYDLNGNVSTSRLRVAPSVPKAAQSNQYSTLELRPRYPLMGGWNYTFALGWDSPLADSAGYDASTGFYVLGVPVQTVIPGAVVNEAEVKIIFPEGATDIGVFPPFDPTTEQRSTHITYLDTIGRPAVTLSFKNLTDKHDGLIYVTYKVPLSVHLRKPKAVSIAFGALFLVALLARRVDLSLSK